MDGSVAWSWLWAVLFVLFRAFFVLLFFASPWRVLFVVLGSLPFVLFSVLLVWVFVFFGVMVFVAGCVLLFWSESGGLCFLFVSFSLLCAVAEVVCFWLLYCCVFWVVVVFIQVVSPFGGMLVFFRLRVVSVL